MAGRTFIVDSGPISLGTVAKTVLQVKAPVDTPIVVSNVTVTQVGSLTGVQPLLTVSQASGDGTGAATTPTKSFPELGEVRTTASRDMTAEPTTIDRVLMPEISLEPRQPFTWNTGRMPIEQGRSLIIRLHQPTTADAVVRVNVRCEE